jgi:hypothetical protein
LVGFSVSCDEFFKANNELRKERLKTKLSNDLYDRITKVIYNSPSLTKEWESIKDKISSNQDTAFFVKTSDFEILVTMRKNYMSDTLNYITYTDSVIKDSIQESRKNHW